MNSHTASTHCEASREQGGDVAVTVILPAFNLEGVIGRSIRSICSVLERCCSSFEVIVVDDGSVDGTFNEALSHADGFRVRVIRSGYNMGKGWALKRGLLESRGEIAVFFDADLDISPRLIPLYVQAAKFYDLVVASKKHPESRYTAPGLRKFMSYIFNVLARLLAGVKVSDTQSGLKAARTDVMRRLFDSILVKRYAYDVELLTVAKLLGLRVVELPIIARVEKLIGVREVFRMFIDLLAIFYRLRILKWYQKRLMGLI